MPIEPIVPPESTASPPPDFLVVPGTGLRLIRFESLHRPLRALFPTAEALEAWLSHLGVPVEPLGPHARYVNAFVLALALQCLTRMRTVPKAPPPPPDPEIMELAMRELLASISCSSHEDVPAAAASIANAAEHMLAQARLRALLSSKGLPPSSRLPARQ